MKFYGWTWTELMSTPITGFWACRRHMERLRCADRLDAFRVACIERSDDRQTREDWLREQQEGLGVVVVEERARDPEAFNTLKDLSQQ